MDKEINNNLENENKQSKFISFIKEFFVYFLIIVAVILIRTFLVTPIRVDGDSMNDTLKDGEILLLKKYDKSYERFEVIVFNYKDEKLIKRIIGLPGDHIVYKDNKLYINNEYVAESMIDKRTYDFDLKELGFDTIPDHYYFVLGDNRINSKDSRMIGLISEKDILGTTNFVLFPFNKMGSINE